MRPIYETPANRTAEAAVAERVANHFGFEARQLPVRYPLDYAFVRGLEVERWVEVKCRTNAMGDYSAYMLSLAKLLGLLAYQRDTGIRACLVVEWSDCVGVLHLPCRFMVGWGGRKDRGDGQDQEPCALIPVGQFQILRRMG